MDLVTGVKQLLGVEGAFAAGNSGHLMEKGGVSRVSLDR